MKKKRFSISSDFKQRLILRTVAFACFIGVGLFLFIKFSVPSFDELRVMVEDRSFRQPVTYWADLHVLRPGDSYRPGDVIKLLKRRGYKAVSAYPKSSKQYHQVSSTHLEVFTDLFTYPDGVVTGGLHHLFFKDDTLVKIGRLKEQVDVSEMRLKPRRLTDVSPMAVEESPWVSLEKISPLLQETVVLSEDRRFYGHFGVDLLGIARAAWVNARQGTSSQGASTLTQQLIKNIYLTPEKTIRRKVIEIVMALMLEWKYSKEFILEMYLNQIYWGQEGARSLYGIGQATQAYFGKSPRDLTAGEVALLVGVIPAPNAYHPRRSPQKALTRRNIVLSLMLQDGKIHAGDYETLVASPLNLAPQSETAIGHYYISTVREKLEESYSRLELDYGGFQVFLAMDTQHQQAAESLLRQQKNVEGALVSLDPRSGYVRALVGGRHYITSPFNRALFAKRQPGSTFKPFVFAAALEGKKTHLADVLSDKPFERTINGQTWVPQNYDGQYKEEVTVRHALVHSRNIPTLNLLEKIGIKTVIKLAQACGIQSTLHPVLSLALGTSEVTPLEMTASYAPFANGGAAVNPIFIRWLVNGEGDIVTHQGPRRQRVLSPETAYLMNDLLRDVVERGTGRGVRRMGYLGPAAGKTGTTDNYTDAWFIGYTPYLLTGVWIGKDKPESLDQSASRLAVPLWTKYMKIVGRPYAKQDQHIPDDIISWEIDPVTGGRARAGCPERITELFHKDGNLPETCSVHSGAVKTFFKKLFGL